MAKGRFQQVPEALQANNEHAGRTAPQSRDCKGRRPRKACGDRSRSDRQLENRSGVERPSGWYKVTIPNGAKYNRNWLLTALENICSVKVTPVQYHVTLNWVHFFVEDPAAASALKQCSRKIADKDCHKIPVYVNRSAPPPSRPSSRPKELPKPKDGHDLPPPTAVKTATTTPPCKECCAVTDEIKGLIERFLQQYYSIFDSGDRRPLRDAYHDAASLSITRHSAQSPSRSSLGEHSKDRRNLKGIKGSRTNLRTARYIVAFLCKFPQTQHDMASFIIDVDTCTDTLLSFTVSGVFRKAAVNEISQESTVAFCRVFSIVPAGDSGVRITDDQLFTSTATTEESRRAFVAPAPTPSSNPVSTITAPQRDLLTAFSKHSGMKLDWSEKCLQDNDWDYNKAAMIFAQLKAEGKIPVVAFVK